MREIGCGGTAGSMQPNTFRWNSGYLNLVILLYKFILKIINNFSHKTIFFILIFFSSFKKNLIFGHIYGKPTYKHFLLFHMISIEH